MSLRSPSRRQDTFEGVSLRKRFSIISVTVKRIVTKSAKDPKRSSMIVGQNRTKSPPIRSGHISSRDWDYVMAITDPNASGDLYPVPESNPGKALAEVGSDREIFESQPAENKDEKDDPVIEILKEYGGRHGNLAATQALTQQWKAMRNPPDGHVHNVYCPLWRPGDTTAPRSECSDKTFTLLSGNPFTKIGIAYLTQWEYLHRQEQ